MELRYKVRKGLKPDLLDKISGMIESQDATTVDFFLTSASSKEAVPNEDMARVFGLIMSRLADGRSIKLLFAYNVAEVCRRLVELKLGAEARKEGRWLRLEIKSQQTSNLIRVLESVSFTAVYAEVGGEDTLPRKPALLFNRLELTYFVSVLTLYDESMEVVSSNISPNTIIDIARAVCAEEKIQISEQKG